MSLRRFVVRGGLWALPLLAGCNGSYCRSDYVAQLSEADAIALADAAVRNAGEDVSRLQPQDREVRYDTRYCTWSVNYLLRKDQLPTGPLVFVNDRTKHAAVGSGM